MSEVTPETVSEYKAAFRSVFDKWLNDELPVPDKEIGNMATAHALGVVFAAKDAEIARLEDEVTDAMDVPWPRWAESILKTMQKYGYDPVVDGEVDLGEAFTDYLDGIGQEDEAQRASLAAKGAELSILSAQNEWLKDRLSDLQLPAKSQKNIEEWLAECGMPTAEVSK